MTEHVTQTAAEVEPRSGLTAVGTTPEELVRRLEDQLVERVERAEHANRRLLWFNRALAGTVALALVGTGLALRRQGHFQEVTARQFVLRGSDGTVRGSWKVLDDGTTRLMLHDSSGVARLKLTVLSGSGAPGVTLADGGGEPRVVLGMLPEQTMSLVFADRAGTTRAVFGLSPDGDPTLVLADRQGTAQVGLGLDGAGKAGRGRGEAAVAENAIPR